MRDQRLIAARSTSSITRFRAASLRAASCVIAILVLLGLYTLFWLSQARDLGVSINWTGEILSVAHGTSADAAGVVSSDYVTFDDYQRLKSFSGEANLGQTIQVVVYARSDAPVQVENGAPPQKTVILQALPGTLSRQISASVEVIVGILFALLGIAPLVARKRDLSLWLFFLSTQLTALFLISDVPRSYHVLWAEIAAYSTFALFPAVLFHFHTLFPVLWPGSRRVFAVRSVYLLALILLPLNLYSILDYSFYVSDVWQLAIGLYLAGTLLGCFALLARTYAKAPDMRARSQVRIVFACSSLGLLSNALLWIPSVLLSLDTEADGILKSLSVFTALSVPVGYAYAMLRYNLLIGGVLWRPALVRVVYSSVMSLVLVAFVTFVWPLEDKLTGRAVLSAWSGILLLVVSMAALYEWASRWMESHLFKGSNYVLLLASLTDQLARFHNLEEFVSFFLETFPSRFKSTGSAIFLAEGPQNRMALHGCSPAISLEPQSQKAYFAASPNKALLVAGHSHALDPADKSDLLEMLREAASPVAVSVLLASPASTYVSADRELLESFKEAGVEWLLPLVSTQREQLIGLVALGAKETDEPFSTQEVTALAALLRTASISAENVLTFAALEKRVKELNQERELSAGLARELSSAQDSERTRIASEIHDTVLQEMVVVLRLLTRLQDQLQFVLGGLEDTSHFLRRSQERSLKQSSITHPAGMTADHVGSKMHEQDKLPVAGLRSSDELKEMLFQCQLILALLLGEDAPEHLSSFQAEYVGGETVYSPPALESRGYGDLMGVAALLSSAVPDGASDSAPNVASQHLLETITSMIQASNQRLREICTDLHPAYLDAPVVKTLTRSVEQFRALNPHIEIILRVCDSEPQYVSDNVKALCKKVSEQAIHNAINHGEPSKIRIELAFGDEVHAVARDLGSITATSQSLLKSGDARDSLDSLLTLSISDNGCGFEAHTPGYWRTMRQHGLASMYESTALIGGDLNISSIIGQGTSVTLIVRSDVP